MLQDRAVPAKGRRDLISQIDNQELLHYTYYHQSHRHRQDCLGTRPNFIRQCRLMRFGFFMSASLDQETECIHELY